MRTVLIVYGSSRQLTNAHKPVHHSRKQPAYFVRIDAVKSDLDLCDTLQLAKPMEFETLLNTIEA